MEIYGKSAVRQARNTRFARARAVEMHMDMMSQEAFCAAIYRENAEPVSPDTRFVRACANTWTCHKRHFARKFTGKMPDASDTTSIEHRALTPTVRTPQCGHTVGEPCMYGKDV